MRFFLSANMSRLKNLFRKRFRSEKKLGTDKEKQEISETWEQCFSLLALLIKTEIGDKNGEAVCYENLGNVSRSRGELVKADDYLLKALAIKKKIGDRNGEALCYGNLAIVFQSLSEFVKAEEYFQKALVIKTEIGDRNGEAQCYSNLATVFHSLGESVKAVEFVQKALVIKKEIGDRNGEAACYLNLGNLFQHLREYHKAEEYAQRGLEITRKIGDKRGEAHCYSILGIGFNFFGEHVKAEEYLRKALVLRKEIGEKRGEASCYENLGSVFFSGGEYSKAKEYHEKALALNYEIGCVERQFSGHLSLTWDTLALNGDANEALSNLLASIQKSERMRGFLRDNDQFKISLLDKNVSPYQLLSALFCATRKPNEALYVVELARARALADMMSVQHSVEQQISVNPQAWIGLEKIMRKESNCTCLYVAYYFRRLFLWVITSNKTIRFREIDINDCFSSKGGARSVDEVFGDETFRKFYVLPAQEHSEDRSLSVSSNCNSLIRESSEGDGTAASRLVEEFEDDDQDPKPPTLAQCYKMIIAPVDDLLDESEIIIVPDRVLYKVPFVALRDESADKTYLSEKFRIRIVPSLTTLKLIQDSPADYHSHTGALIVGEPAVSNVYYKGSLEKLCPLPGARKEAEMIGRLLGAQPLLGEQATKQTVLQSMQSVSLIHFAAHDNSERGEIALAPPPSFNGFPEEDDYLLSMAEISRARLRAKLVVRSCCHSARGQIRSEGICWNRSILLRIWCTFRIGGSVGYSGRGNRGAHESFLRASCSWGMCQ